MKANGVLSVGKAYPQKPPQRIPELSFIVQNANRGVSRLQLGPQTAQPPRFPWETHPWFCQDCGKQFSDPTELQQQIARSKNILIGGIGDKKDP